MRTADGCNGELWALIMGTTLGLYNMEEGA